MTIPPFNASNYETSSTDESGKGREPYPNPNYEPPSPREDGFVEDPRFMDQLESLLDKHNIL